MPGVDAQGILVAGDGLVIFSLVHEGVAQVDVGMRVEGLKAQRLAIKRDRFGKLSLVQESIAQVDVRLDVVGVEL